MFHATRPVIRPRTAPEQEEAPCQYFLNQPITGIVATTVGSAMIMVMIRRAFTTGLQRPLSPNIQELQNATITFLFIFPLPVDFRS